MDLFADDISMKNITRLFMSIEKQIINYNAGIFAKLMNIFKNSLIKFNATSIRNINFTKFRVKSLSQCNDKFLS